MLGREIFLILWKEWVELIVVWVVLVVGCVKGEVFEYCGKSGLVIGSRIMGRAGFNILRRGGTYLWICVSFIYLFFIETLDFF